MPHNPRFSVEAESLRVDDDDDVRHINTSGVKISKFKFAIF